MLIKAYIKDSALGLRLFLMVFLFLHVLLGKIENIKTGLAVLPAGSGTNL